MVKEKIYTIPLNDAVNAKDECPFCYVEREVEQDLLDFALGAGSSYMESDVRAATDQAGFCRAHFKKMFDYGNTLGNAWILKTHYERMNREMKEQFQKFVPGKSQGLFKHKESENAIADWITQKENSCYICNQAKATYERYLDTFFYMYQKDEEFRERIQNSKGFCLSHFKDLCLGADKRLREKEKEQFYAAMFELMEKNMERLQEDVSWMVDKFDYRNKNADWKNSRDAIQRGMQKLKGGYPADLPYVARK